MSNGGRHYEPWNGRVISVLAIEEITAFFYHGRAKSVANNKLSEKGFKTFADIKKDNPFDVKVIVGVVPIKSSFKGVESIERKDSAAITIVGRNNERIDVSCQVDFLC
jgi:hypothetical protein